MIFQEKLNGAPAITIGEFAKTIKGLFYDEMQISLEEDYIIEFVKNGSIMLNTNNLVPSVELKRFHPKEFVSLECFANEAGLAFYEVENLLNRGQIQVIKVDNRTIVHRNQLRAYCRSKNVQMVYCEEDLLKMLDKFFEETAVRWNDEIFSNRVQKKADFLVDVPDESLVRYVEDLKINVNKVLELGCGQGRNAIFLAKRGATVDAVDKSEVGIRWAIDNAKAANVQINFINKSIFDIDSKIKSYDFVYDGGCFHHIPPHRRWSYKNLINTVLKPNGHLGMVFFNRVLYDHTDWEIYKNGSTKSGIPYSREQLEKIFGNAFEIVDFRQMRDCFDDFYGRGYLSTILLKKKLEAS